MTVIEIGRGISRKELNTQERAKPIGLLVEADITGGVPGIDLHLAYGIDREFSRDARETKPINVYFLRQIL